MLYCFPVWFNGSGYVNAMPQESRLPMDLVTGHRAISATDTQIHVHDEQVRAIDYASRDFLGSGRDSSSVGWRFGPIVIRS
jgi:hypothetical protein